MSFNAQVIRDSFEKIKPLNEIFTSHFFENLGNDYPQSRVLFASANLPELKTAFFKSWTYIIDHLDESERLHTYLKALGGRHVNHGVNSAQPFEWVGNTFLKTMGQILGADWSNDIQREWAAAYTSFALMMLEGITNVQLVRQGATGSLKGHLHMAPLNPNPVQAPVPVTPPTITPTQVAAPTLAQNPLGSPTHFQPVFQSPSVGGTLDLPQNVRDQITKAAADFVQSKLQEAFNQAVKSELAKINSTELLSSLKKAA